MRNAINSCWAIGMVLCFIAVFDRNLDGALEVFIIGATLLGVGLIMDVLHQLYY